MLPHASRTEIVYLEYIAQNNLKIASLRNYVSVLKHYFGLFKELGKIPQGVLLVNLDVSSLYTNIPNQNNISISNSTKER